MSNELTVEQVQKAIPSRKGSITPELVEIINKANNEPEFQGESLLQLILTYEGVMQKHKASVKDYIYALRFCAYLITEEDNYTEAYRRAFADREFVYSRSTCKTDSADYAALTSAASRYRKSKMVADILTVSQAPLNVMFQGARYKALWVLADRVDNAKLDKDRIAAADILLKHTAPTDSMKIELAVGVTENSATQNLMEQLMQIAGSQKKMLEAGATTLGTLGSMKVVSEIVEGEYEEV